MTVRTTALATRNTGLGEEAKPVADACLGVIRNERINADYKLLTVAAEPPQSEAAAGQFFHIRCPGSGRDQPYLRRPMSIYRADRHEGVLEFLYKITGAGTRGLATLESGDRLPVMGPLGNRFELDPQWRSIVVVGRGVGLATLAPLAELAAARGAAVTAILSARDPSRIMSVDRFEAAGADVITVTDSEGTSEPARLKHQLQHLIEAGRADAFFTCGSNRLMLLLQELGRKHGIPGQVALEQQMACGLGMCFCCVRTFNVGGRSVSRRVCWEGPVFDLQEATTW